MRSVRRRARGVNDHRAIPRAHRAIPDRSGLAPSGRTEFFALDITLPTAGPQLRERFGEANVFIRGVLHVLGADEQRAVATTMSALLGSRGRALIAETDFRAGVLAYLAHLGATPRHIPEPLRQAIMKLPRPHHFGQPERTRTFPADTWQLLLERPGDIAVVPTRGDEPEIVPGYVAVLGLRSS